MSQIQIIKENLFKRLEAEKNSLKSEIKEKFSYIIDAIKAMKTKEVYEMQTCEVGADSKNWEEQIGVRESELTEYEEGDLKTSLAYVYELKRDNRKIEHQFNEAQTSFMEAYNQSEAIINQMVKYKTKLFEIPAMKEAERIKSETTLENQMLKLNAVKQEIRDCHEQEEASLAKIAENEAKITEVLAKSEELTNSINIENELAEKIAQFKNEIIPDIANEIEKVKMNIESIENVIVEKKEVNGNAIKLFNDINAKVISEQAKDTSLHEELQIIMKLKNDIINKNISSKDIEEIPNLQNLAFSDEYKKQMEKIDKLTADNAQIIKDSQEAKKNKEESEKALKILKEVKAQVEDILGIKKDEVTSLEKEIEGKEAELRSLNDEMIEIEKDKSINEAEKESLDKEIVEMTTAYKELSNKLNVAQNRFIGSDENAQSKESDLKTVDMKVSINNNKNNVHKWLNGLPQKFSKNSPKSNILSQNSTAHFDDSDLNISTTRQEQLKDSSFDGKIFNLEIEDPEEIDANVSTRHINPK